MQAARDLDGEAPAFGPDETDTILVGLAISDRALALRIRAMISQMATMEDVDIDHADVILTDVAHAHTTPHLVLQDRAAMDGTANGIDKTTGKDVLEAAICLVAHGYRVTAPRAEHPRRAAASFEDGPAEAGEPLTAREQQVLDRLAAGASNKMIARDLNISLATAKFHVGSLLAKLGARNRTDAVAIGLKLGLLLL